MHLSPAWFVCALLLGGGLQTQSEPVLKKPKTQKPAVASASAPVTQNEVYETFRVVSKALKQALGLNVVFAPEMKGKPSAATKSQIIRLFQQVFNAAEPQFAYTPVRLPYDSLVFVCDAASKPTLEALVAWGLVAPRGSLAALPDKDLTPRRVGDAIAYMLLRVSELTHTPSAEFSPFLLSGEKLPKRPKSGG